MCSGPNPPLITVKIIRICPTWVFFSFLFPVPKLTTQNNTPLKENIRFCPHFFATHPFSSSWLRIYCGGQALPSAQSLRNSSETPITIPSPPCLQAYKILVFSDSDLLLRPIILANSLYCTCHLSTVHILLFLSSCKIKQNTL